MNYYERHLGDYARDAGHLSMLEHGAYTLLLDRYYSTEQPIPVDQAYRVARARSKDEKAAVDAVLAEFFTLVDGCWHNGRTDEEIAKAQSRINAAQANGRRGGRPRKKKEETQQKPSGFSLGSDSETQQKAHQTPDTNHQTKEKEKTKAPAAPAPLPDWMPIDAWRNFLAMRAKIRKPPTDRAVELLIGELDTLRQEGQDVAKVLDQSTLNSWQGVFAVKSTGDRPAASRPAPRAESFASTNYGTGGAL